MFIGWISQILPLMDKPEGEAIEGILHSIAVDYPQVEFKSYVHIEFRLYVSSCSGNLLSLQDQPT